MMYSDQAIEIVFDFFCMLVDERTDVLDYPRHMITAIHQAENYCELVHPELIDDIKLMENNWYKGKL